MTPITSTTTFRGSMSPMLRFHLHDWIAIAGLIILEVVLNVIHPYKRFVSQYDIDDFRYPFNNNTIPVAAVPVIALGIPLVFIIAYFIYKRDHRDLHQAVLGLIFAVLITAVITDSVKDAVGRPRPDFFWRCFPDGKGVFDPKNGRVLCTGKASDIKEGHKSFPSGHTSWSFAGLGYLSLYLAGKLKIFDRRGRVAKLIVVVIPLLAATLVAISRVDDYWHHWQDVFTGAFIGLVMAHICYRQHFPNLYDEYCMRPYPLMGGMMGPQDWPPPSRTSNGDLENGMSVEVSRF